MTTIATSEFHIRRLQTLLVVSPKILALLIGLSVLTGCATGNFTPRMGFIIESQGEMESQVEAGPDSTKAENIVVAVGFQRVPTEQDGEVFTVVNDVSRWISFYGLHENPRLGLSIKRYLYNSSTWEEHSSKPNALGIQIGEYCGWCNIGCFSDSGRATLIQTHELLIEEFGAENVKARSNCMNAAERKDFFQIE